MRISAATRQEIINKSLRSEKGKQRYLKRLLSMVKYPNRSLRSVDVQKWFEEDILDADIDVRGETDSYVVTLSIWGVWENYTGDLTARNVAEAIKRTFRSEDVYIHCSCPDFLYRFSYQRTKDGTISKSPQSRPAPIRNPKDSLGSACKHTLLTLVQSHRWINELATQVVKYVRYIKRSNIDLYDKFIKDRIE